MSAWGLSYSYEHPTSLSTVSDCDDCGEVVTLPFSFKYYGESYSSLTISSNGFVVLGSNLTGALRSYNLDPMRFMGTNDINPNVSERMIAPLWDDWNPAKGGEVYYGVVPSGAFVVEWKGVMHDEDASASPGTYSFELKLQPSGQFEFHYVKMCGAAVGCSSAFDYGYSAHGGYTYQWETIGTMTHWPKDPTRSLHPIYSTQAFGWKPYAENTVWIKGADEVVDRPQSHIKTRVSWTCSNGSSTSAMTADTVTGQMWQAFALYCAVGGYVPVLSSATVQQTSAWARADWMDPLPFYVPPSRVPLLSTNSSGVQAPVSAVTSANAVTAETATPSTAYRFARVLTWPKPERKYQTWYPYNAWEGTEACTKDTSPPAGGLSWMDSECPAGNWWTMHDKAAKAQRLYPFPFYGLCDTGCKFHSIWDWYRGADAKKDKVMLVVPGIDSLNSDTSVIYYDLLNKTGLLGRLLNEGWDVVIADYSDGHRELKDLTTEVGTWIRKVSGETDIDPATGKPYKIHVAGVSQGGVLVRYAISKDATMKDVVAAWYSIDAPQRRANLGSGERGLGTLLRGTYSETDWQYINYASPPSKQMLYEHCYSVNKPSPGFPEDWDCSYLPPKHPDNPSKVFYDQVQAVGVPTDIPHYALAFGDVYASTAPLDNGLTNERGYRGRTGFLPSGKLYDWTYDAACSANQQWYSDPRDCVTGSSYVDSSIIDTTKGIFIDSLGLCNNVTVKLTHKPAFIPIHSALDWQGDEDKIFGTCKPADWYPCWDASAMRNGWCVPGERDCRASQGGGLLSDMCYTTSVGYRFAVQPPAHWNDWAGNQGNWPHCAVSPYLAERLYNWVTGGTTQTTTVADTATPANVSCFE